MLYPEKKESYQYFNVIARYYNFLNHLFSFGLDFFWRKSFRNYLPLTPPSPLSVLDVAAGTGDVSREMARDRRVGHVTALDMSSEMLALGEKMTSKSLQKKIYWCLGDGVKIPFPLQSFDVVTMAFGIRNFHDPKASLENIYRVLKPGGRLLIMEFAHPRNPLFKALYLLYFRHILPLIAHFFTKRGDIYRYFNKSVEQFPYGESFLDLLKDHSFKKTSVQYMAFGIVALYYGEKEL